MIPRSRENELERWEKLYLVHSPTWTTYAFSRCAAAFAYPLVMICESALRIKFREPDLFASVWPIYPIMLVPLLYLGWRQIGIVRNLRGRLIAAKGTPEYPALLSSAKAKDLTFVRLGFAYGTAVIVLEIMALLFYGH